MGKPYSMDLRERVVAAVKTGSMSCNQAAKQFGVGISTAINWVKRLRETGSVAPGKMGGHKPKSISGEHRMWLLQRIKEGDFTLRGLVAELTRSEAPSDAEGAAQILQVDHAAAQTRGKQSAAIRSVAPRAGEAGSGCGSLVF